MNEIIQRPLAGAARGKHRYGKGERATGKTRIYYAMAPTNGERQRVLLMRTGSACRLYSYHTARTQKRNFDSFFEELETCRELGYHLFLDSGAYSLQRDFRAGSGLVYNGDYEKLAGAGADIVDFKRAYKRFVRNEGWRFDVYANLDYVQVSQTVWDIQIEMEREGLTPIPTIHGDDGFEWVHRYIDAGHDYLGVSAGARRGSYGAIRPYLDAVFEIAESRGVKLHGYAMTSPKVIVQYPWYSVDSATCLKAARCAQIFAPRPDKGFNRLAASRASREENAWLAEMMLERDFDFPIMCRYESEMLGPAYMERLCWNMYVMENLDIINLSPSDCRAARAGGLLGGLA